MLTLHSDRLTQIHEIEHPDGGPMGDDDVTLETRDIV
jgi:hypothetical protein